MDGYLDLLTLPLPDSAVVVVALAVGAAGVGVALAYFLGDPRSPATRALAFSVGVVGVANVLYPAQHVLHPHGDGTHWLVGMPVLDALVMSGLLLWMLRVFRASRPTARAGRLIGALVVTFGLVTGVYLALGALHPTERMTRFLFCLGADEGCSGPWFATFAVPVATMGTILVLVGLLVLTQQVDRAERQRIICVALATPWFFANYVLPAGYNVLTSLPGLFIFLVGGVRYQQIVGQRGLFLSRFLSEAVVEEVGERGLAHTMQPKKVELTVVSVDLRGFTHFSAVHDSDSVMRLIDEYYEAVGEVVAKHHATIQAYAGDGILLLMGAPLAVPDHAARGLAMAHDVLLASLATTRRWAAPESPLSAGVGVASGFVTVGAIGASTRMEYTALGMPTNLASRLCDAAGPGELLVDQRTVELAGQGALEERTPIPLKGFGATPHFGLVVSGDRRASAEPRETHPVAEGGAGGQASAARP